MRNITVEDKRILNNLNRRLSNLMKKTEKAGIDFNFSKRNISSFKTRKDFNSYIKKANSVLSSSDYKLKTNKYGFTYSQSDKTNLDKALEKRNKARLKKWNKIKNIPISSAGVNKNVTIGEMSKMIKNEKLYSFNEIKRDINKIKSRNDYNKLIKMLNEQSSGKYYDKQDEIFRENFLKAIKEVWSTDEEMVNVINKIKNMDLDDFMKYYYSDDYVSPAFVYMVFVDDDKRRSIILDIFG